MVACCPLEGVCLPSGDGGMRPDGESGFIGLSVDGSLNDLLTRGRPVSSTL